MSGNSKSAPGWARFKPGSANTMFVVCACCALLLIGAVIYWTQSRAEPTVNLLTGTKLLEHDLSRMQLAFGKAGLNDFEVRDGLIFVPQGQRDRFLKALNDHGGIPETSREIYEPESVNPWATSLEVQESNLLRKKRMIRQLVLQLEFVADAVVDYDELVDAGWPPTTHRSAAVVVHPRGSRLLELYQIEAIRNTICGAVAGLSPSDIVITDISAGHAYVGPPADGSSCPPPDLDWLERAKLEQRIRDQLSQFGDGIDVHITLQDADRDDDTDSSASPTVSKLAKPDAPLANQPMSLKTNDSEIESKLDPPDSERQVGDNQSMAVTIRIAEQCVRRAALACGAGMDQDKTLEQQFQLLQSQIKNLVQPLLNSAATPQPRTRIVVSMIHQPHVAASSSGEQGAWNWRDWQKYGPAAGVSLIAVVILALSLGRRQTTASESRIDRQILPDESMNRQQPLARPAEDSIPEDTKRKLRQMVDDDPDEAAEIIKQWIRGAA